MEAEDECELSFINPRGPSKSVHTPSKTPSRERIRYLWGKVRRLSRAFGRFIKVWKDIKLYGGSRNHYNNTVVRKESLDTATSGVPIYIILTNSPFRKLWTVINIVLLLWTAIVTPYQICFIESASMSWFVIDLIIDSLFTVDIFCNFFSAYIDFEGKLVTDHKQIVKNYLKGWFLIDFFGILPFQYIGEMGGYNRLVRFSRMPRLYKVLRIVRLFKMVRLLRSQACIAKIVNFFRLATGLIRMVKFCFTVLLVVHVIGCFWYYLAKFDDFGPETWIFRYGMLDFNEEEIYLASIYYVIQTLATVGFGDIVPYSAKERIFALLLMGVGVGFYSYTISNLSTIMATLDTRTSNLKRKLKSLDEFAKATKLPPLLKKKIKNHINHNHQENVYSWFDKDALLKELPASLRREISIHMHKKIVEKISFFQDKDPQFISYVVPRLKNVRMQAGELLCKEGDYAEEIFFLVKGRVNLKVASGIIFKTYEQGSYFGEVEVLMNKARQYTIQIATRDAEFLVISKRDFLNILKEFPNISNEVRETAKIREMKNQEAKVFALNMNRSRPREFKRSTTIKSKRRDFGTETRGWSNYAQSVTRDPPPEISLGNTTWEKKANIRYINSNNPYYDIKKASIIKKGELDEALESNPNPTVASIIFSPAQFQLRKEKNSAKGKPLNDFEVGNHSPDVTYNDSFYNEPEKPLELRKILVDLNYSEAEAEKTLVDTIEMLHDMEEQQKRACEKISEFLDI